MTKAPAILAQPFTPQELADFELFIFMSNDKRHGIRLKAVAGLAAFVKKHGKPKCDMMLAELSRFHEDKTKRPDA